MTNKKQNKKHVYLTGAQKKEMISQFIDGYNAEELAALFSVCYKTATKVLRPTRAAMLAARKAAEAVDAMKATPKAAAITEWQAVNAMTVTKAAKESSIQFLSLIHI